MKENILAQRYEALMYLTRFLSTKSQSFQPCRVCERLDSSLQGRSNVDLVSGKLLSELALAVFHYSFSYQIRRNQCSAMSRQLLQLAIILKAHLRHISI